uniref:Putative LOC100114766 [Nasonia vitripennis] n=1 Tax=Lepeophtheirus salmonis TaxID=72036 RepID=A0A0K2SYK5_LEPSM
MSSDLWLRMRREEAEQFHSLVKMHLSFLLHLNTDDCDCSFVLSSASTVPLQDFARKKSSGAGLFSTTPKRLRRGVMDGLPLTMEGVCQIYQLILYLSSKDRITTEGIFRKHGSLKKAQSLRERLNKGLSMDLDDNEFSVHEVASVFKGFLADLPEPLLTDSYYGAHVQVTSLEDDVKKVQCLQLLFLLIPEPNYRLLKDTLSFLHKVSLHEDRNKMSSSNLGTVFSTHVLCPRKLSAEALKSNHVLLTKSVSFMIEKAPQLFEIPSQLMTDIKMYWNQRKCNASIPTIVHQSPPGSPVVNTVFTFVDRQATKEVSKDSSTDTALAALYAHVQTLPESAQKKKLIQRLNEANGCGTPGRNTPTLQGNNKKTRGLRHGGGLALKSLLTPKRSNVKEDAVSGRIGSYSFSTPFKNSATSQLHSFKRQNSANAVSPNVTPCTNQKLLSPQSSPAILVSPQTLEAAINATPNMGSLMSDYYPKTIGTPTGLKAPTIDLNSPSTPKCVPPIPVRVSSLPQEDNKDPSPITSVAMKMPSDMQETLMTPRCRRPVMAIINESRDSPCQPSKYNEDEPYNSPLFDDNDSAIISSSSSSSNCDESDRYFESLEDEDDETDRSLLPEFKKYIEEKVASKVDMDFNNHDNDNNEITRGNINPSLISQEADELLNGEMQLSESMKMVLDGHDPEQNNKGIEPSVLEPVDVDDNSEFPNDENILDPMTPKSQRKRRSLTEKSTNNPLTPSNKSINPKSIYFETDL